MFGLVFLACFVAVLTQVGASSVWKMPDIPENNTNILPAWREIDKLFKNTTSSLIKRLLPKILESSSKLNLSLECVQQSMQLVYGLKSMKTWAISMVDSSSKFPNGLAAGAFTDFGVYEQCLDIVVPESRNQDRIQFQGQYCLVESRFPLPPKSKRYTWFSRMEELKNFTGSELLTMMSTKAQINYIIPITMGVCIPSGCSKVDLKKLVHEQVKKYNILNDVIHCEVKNETVNFRRSQIAAIVLCCILSCLVILGTLFEVNSDTEKIKHRGLRLLLCFSTIKTFRKLTSTKTSSNSFNCLHGMRFLTITWVVLGHTYYFPASFVTRYRLLFRVFDFSSEFFTQIMTNGSVCVDTFFFMGIVPAYYFILLCCLLVPLMGSGPMFQDTMKDSVDPCFRYWWRNILFINNFYPINEMCMVHFWYIACDMQLFLVSVIVLFALQRSVKVGIFLSVLFVVSSIIYSGAITYIKDLMPTVSLAYIDPEDRIMFNLYTYGNVLSQAGPYFLGILTGYLLHIRPDIKIPKVFQAVGWCVASVTCGTIVFLPSAWFKLYLPSPIERAMYAAFYKVSFTAGIAWMTFCCVTGRGGYINAILSWKLWVPLSKLTFLIYLIHPYPQHVFIANFKTAQECAHLPFVLQYFGFLSISILLAFIASFLIESPFVALEKALLGRGERKVKNMKEENNRAFKNTEFSVKTYEETIGIAKNCCHKEPHQTRL